jgi:hypothetical protein
MTPKMDKKMTIRLVKSLLLYLGMVTVVMCFAGSALAQNITSELSGLSQQIKLPSFQEAGHAEASYESGASNITSAILYAVDLLKYMMGTVAVMIIIAIGVRLITAGKNIEEISPKMKEALKYVLIGLVVIIMSQEVIKGVFFGEQGEVFRSQTDIQLAAEKGTEELRGLYRMMELFMGTIAVLIIVVTGFRLVTSGGNEDVVNKSKKSITYAVIGLIVLGLSELFVKDIIFPKQGSSLPDVVRAQQQIVTMTNFASSFITLAAIDMLMYGGFLYVTAAGKEDNTGKAKKVIFGAVIGLIIAMAAYGIVNTVIKVEPLIEQTTQLTTQMNQNTP